MENLFDLLIILFIIYAFLSPLLKKKKPPIQLPPQPYETETKSEPVAEKSSQDILREIEELFGYKSEKPEEVLTQGDEEFHQVESQTAKSEKSSQKVEKYETAEQNVPTFSEIKSTTEKIEIHPELESFDYEGTIPETEIDEFDYSKLDDYVYNQVEKETSITDKEKTFSLQLNEIDDFKKAIIYKEIFDSPIALRMRRIKWQRNIY